MYDQSALPQLQGGLDRIGKAFAKGRCLSDDQPVHDHLDGVLFVFGQELHILYGLDDAVDAHPGVALFDQSLEPFAMLALAVFHDGGQQQDLGIERKVRDLVHHFLGIAVAHPLAAADAELFADAREQYT